MMHMFMDFTRDVQFVFKQWYAKDTESAGWLWLGLIMSCLYCFAHMFLPRIEKFIKEFCHRNGYPLIVTKLALTLYQFFYQISNIMVMMIMMTMNFWTGLAIALGCGVGFAFNGASLEWKKAVQKTSQTSDISNTTSNNNMYAKF